MLAPKSKWAEVFMAFDAARWRIRRREEHESRIFRRGLLWFVLGMLLLCLTILLFRAVRS